MEKYKVWRTRVVSFVLPTGLTFNSDNLQPCYLAAGLSIFVAPRRRVLRWVSASAGNDVDTDADASKGVAGLPLALVILAATASSFGLPEWPIAAILSIRCINGYKPGQPSIRLVIVTTVGDWQVGRELEDSSNRRYTEWTFRSGNKLEKSFDGQSLTSHYFTNIRASLISAQRRQNYLSAGTQKYSMHSIQRRSTRSGIVIMVRIPYHGRRWSHGLCFSVPKNQKFLLHCKIFTRRTQSLRSRAALTVINAWAAQGVLLLNTV